MEDSYHVAIVLEGSLHDNCLICGIRIDLGRLLCFEHTRVQGKAKSEWARLRELEREAKDA